MVCKQAQIKEKGARIERAMKGKNREKEFAMQDTRAQYKERVWTAENSEPIVDDNQEKEDSLSSAAKKSKEFSSWQISIAKRLFSKIKGKKKEWKKRTRFNCQGILDLLDDCSLKGHCSLKVQKGGKKKIEEVLVFHRQDEIANHYGVGKQTISNLANSGEEEKSKIRQDAAMNPKKSTIQVHHRFGCFLLCLIVVFVF